MVKCYFQEKLLGQIKQKTDAVSNVSSRLFFQVTHIKAPKTAEDEFIEIQSATGTPVQRWAVRSLTLCKLVRKRVLKYFTQVKVK